MSYSWSGTIGWNAPSPRRVSWAGLLDWTAPAVPASWVGYIAWEPMFDRLIAVSSAALARALARWDERLSDLGGDPARDDWSDFRPLRLSREEDWSDWLAHLFEHAPSGRFPARVFGGGVGAADRWKVASCTREFVAEDYRADIIVRFPDEEWIHVEVKVGDLHLAKTPETGAAARRQEPGRCRGDFLLIPEGDVSAWDTHKASLGDQQMLVEVRTWRDVAIGLRKSVAEPGVESTSWRVWARSFVGAIEQRLLGFPPAPLLDTVKTRRPSAGDLKRLQFLESMEPS